jgi:hypothetical protein
VPLGQTYNRVRVPSKTDSVIDQIESSNMEQIRIRHVPISSLVADAMNARTHNERQIGQIARSIELFGFNNPILINMDHKVVAGHTIQIWAVRKPKWQAEISLKFRNSARKGVESKNKDQDFR